MTNNVIQIKENFMNSEQMVSNFQFDLESYNLDKSFNQQLFIQDELLHLCDRFILFTIEEIHEMYDELSIDHFDQNLFLEEYSDICLYLFSFLIDISRYGQRIKIPYNIHISEIKIYNDLNYKSFFNIDKEQRKIIPRYEEIPFECCLNGIVRSLVELRKYFPIRKYHRKHEVSSISAFLSDFQLDLIIIIEDLYNQYMSFFNNETEALFGIELLLESMTNKQKQFLIK